MTVVDHPAGDQETADETATARSQQVGSAAFEATAVAIGHPALKAGEAVSIAGVDPALEGKWVITGSRHEFGNGPYRTALEFTGRQDRSIHGLVSQGSAGGGGGMQRYYGVAVAIVTDNKDPDDARAGQGLVPLALGRRGVVVGAPGRAGRGQASTASSSCRRSATRCSSRSTTATSTSRSCSVACGTARTSSRSTTTPTSTQAR